MTVWRLAAAGLLGLAACSTVPDTSAPQAGRLIPADDGLDVAGTGLQIGFGRAQTGAVAAATKAQGRGPDSVSNHAGCAQYSWRDGLSMHVIGGAFTGWTDTQARTGVARSGRTCT